jgi:hypothetical protein
MSGLAEEPVVEHAATDPNVNLPQSPAAASVGTTPGSGMSASSRKGCRVTPCSELRPTGSGEEPLRRWRVSQPCIGAGRLTSP